MKKTAAFPVQDEATHSIVDKQGRNLRDDKTVWSGSLLRNGPNNNLHENHRLNYSELSNSLGQ